MAELGGLPELEASQNRIALRSGCSFAGNDGIFVTILPARSAASGSGLVSMAQLGVRRFRQGAAEVDEVVGDDAEPDPALHTIITFVSAAGEAVPALDDADAALATGSPLLAVAEPALLLLAFARRALA